MSKSSKIILAVILLITGLVVGYGKYRKIKPPLQYEPPKSQIEMEQKSKTLKIAHEFQMKSLNLTEEQQKNLTNWEKWNAKNKTKEEKKAHNEELAKILSEDQINKYKEINKQKKANEKIIKDEKQARLKQMLGDAEYQKFIENQKKRQALKTAKNKAKNQSGKDLKENSQDGKNTTK